MALDLEPIDNTATVQPPQRKLDLEPIQPSPQPAPAGPRGTGLALEPISKQTAELANNAPTSAEYKITRQEIKDIANKHGADSAKLEALAPYYGGSVQSSEGQERGAGEIAKRTIGELSENTLLNIPQYAFKRLGLKPAEQSALEEVVDRMKDRETAADLGIDIAASAPSLLLGYGEVSKGVQGLSKGAQVLAKVGAAGAMGAVQGVTGSKKGKELESAAIGAGAGIVLGAAMDAGAALLKKGGGKLIDKATEMWVNQEGARIADKVAVDRALTRELDDTVAKAVTAKGEQAVPSFKKTIEEVPDEFRKELLDQGMPEAAIVDQYNKLKLDDERIQFANYLNRAEGKEAGITTAKEASEVLKDKTATDGEQFVQKQFDSYKDVQSSYSVMREDMDNLNTPKGKFLERAIIFISDNRPIAAIFDKRNGTNLQVVLDDLSQKNKQYTLEMASTLPVKRELAASLEKVNGPSIVAAMRNGDISTLNEGERNIANRLESIYESRRQRVNEMGLPIKKIEGQKYYVPEQMMEPADTIVAMRKQVSDINRRLGINLENLSPLQFDEVMKKPELGELKQAITAITHLDDLSNPYKFAAGLKSSMNPGKASELMDMGASAAFKREGSLPDFLRETDPLKLLNNWDRDTFRTIYYRDGLDDLRKLRMQYLSSSDRNAATMVQNLVLDLTGRKRGTLANGIQDGLQKISVNAKDRIQQGNDTAINRMLASAPDTLMNITNQVYPNFLGWNPRTALTNLTQPIVMAVPEIGPQYGSKLYGSAYLKALKTIGTGEEIVLSREMAATLGKEAGEKITTRDLGLILKNKGLIGENWNTEMTKLLDSSAFSKGSKLNKLTSAVGTANEELNKLGMQLFDKSETINRYTTDIVGKQLGQDFIKRKPEAIAFFNKGLSVGYKQEITEAMARQDYQRVEELFSQHLMAKTMFNYDRITMSELGRWMGPGLSAFMKWPTAIAGDIASTVATRSTGGAAVDLGRRYLAPMAALSLIEHMVVSTEDKNSDRYKYFFGHEGLTKGAPINVVKDILQGKTAKPPAVSTAGDLGLGLFDAAAGDPQKLWKWTNNTIFSYTPQAGLVNFLSTGIPTVIAGKTPEGTFTGKIQEGLTGDNTLDSFFKKNKD